MHFDLTPIPCYLGTLKGEIFCMSLQDEMAPLFSFLGKDGVTHWDLTIDNFALDPRPTTQGLPLSTYNVVFDWAIHPNMILLEFKAEHLTTKEAWIVPHKAKGRYIKSFLLDSRTPFLREDSRSGGIYDRIHILNTDSGFALCSDFDVLFGVEELPREVSHEVEGLPDGDQEKKPAKFEREPIKTAGSKGAGLLDMLGFTPVEGV